MKHDVQVFIIVFCDKDPRIDEKKIARIRNEIAEIAGVVNTYSTPRVHNAVTDSNIDIVATAFWEESEIPEKEKIILKIDGVKKVETRILVSI